MIYICVMCDCMWTCFYYSYFYLCIYVWYANKLTYLLTYSSCHNVYRRAVSDPAAAAAAVAGSLLLLCRWSRSVILVSESVFCVTVGQTDRQAGRRAWWLRMLSRCHWDNVITEAIIITLIIIIVTTISYTSSRRPRRSMEYHASSVPGRWSAESSGPPSVSAPSLCSSATAPASCISTAHTPRR